MFESKVARLIWILGIITQARGTQYKTTITRNDGSANQTAVSDHVVIEKCTDGMNCTEACRRDCKPKESLWWMNEKPKCIKDDQLIKNIEGIFDIYFYQ